MCVTCIEEIYYMANMDGVDVKSQLQNTMDEKTDVAYVDMCIV